MEEKFSWLEQISKQCEFQKALAFNRPYEFNGVKFYPVGVDMLIEFNMCVNVLTVHQEWCRDKKLLKLPYMWFICYAFEHNKDYPEKPEYSMYIPMLYALIEMTTHSNDIDIIIDKKNNGDYSKCDLFINKIRFSYKDFEKMKKIILEQAAIEVYDDFIHEDAWKAIQKDKEFDNRSSKHINPTIEDLCDIVSMYYGISVEEMKNKFTIRKFNNVVRRMSMFEEWKIAHTGEMSGMVKFNSPIKHWISGFSENNPFEGLNTNYKQALEKVL